jgi:hypothetical protein
MNHPAHQPALDPFTLCVIHKEGMCPSNGGINRLMMMIIMMSHTYDTFPLPTVLNANCIIS